MASEPFLKFGKKGVAVRRLQERLLRLGFDPLGIDGDFGVNTENAVKAFQRAAGLVDDGQVGPLTWAAITAAELGSQGVQQVSPFRASLAAVAVDQHDRFHMRNEADPALCGQIRKYWTDLGLGFTSCVNVPWSAVFVSWCVQSAGATAAEFTFAAAHSVFVHAAIRNATNGTGVFHGVDIGAAPAGVGDIIQNNRGGASHDFAFAKTHAFYTSHSAIVVQVAQDGGGPFAVTVGGNESDSVRRTIVRLTPGGLIRQRAGSPYIALIKTLK